MHLTISYLNQNWDILDITVDLLDDVGCLKQDEKHLHVAPNGRNYILRPTEHSAFHVKSS